MKENKRTKIGITILLILLGLSLGLNYSLHNKNTELRGKLEVKTVEAKEWKKQCREELKNFLKFIAPESYNTDLEDVEDNGKTIHE